MQDATDLFINAWRLMNRRFESSSFEQRDGVASCFGHVPLLFFNLSILSRPASTPDAFRGQLRTAASHGATCAHPTGIVLQEDWMPAGWEAVLAEEGLAPMMPMTAMEAGELLPPRRPAPPELEIRRVADDRAARHVAELNAHAYQMPAELFGCMANLRFWPDEHFAFVGYANGEPVSSAAAIPVDNTVYIALVATLPGAQGRGYAENVMRHAVIEGQRAMGTMRTTLHATAQGRPVYEAMGYRAGPGMLLVGRH